MYPQAPALAVSALPAPGRQMKILQLRYVLAIVDANLNMSMAAGRLYKAQPGISRQIRLLE